MNLKNLFLMTIISWSLGIMACEPDPPTEPETLNYPFTLENATPTPDVEQAIDDFKAYLENSELHRLESMDIDDAVWSVEATLNQTYTNAAHNFEDLSVKTQTININRSGATMSSDDVILFYNSALDSLASHFYSLPDNNRLPIVVDVSLSDNPDILTITTHIGTGTSSDITASFDNHWYWGYNVGACGPSVNDLPYSSKDATVRLEEELNSRVLAINDLGWVCPTSIDCRPYFTSIETTNVVRYDEVLNDNDDVPGDNYRDYLIYRNEWGGFDNYYDNLCLSPDELSFYFSNAVQVIDAFRPNYPNDDFIDIVISPIKQDNDPVGDRYDAEHIYSIYYGRISYVVGPPGVIW